MEKRWSLNYSNQMTLVLKSCPAPLLPTSPNPKKQEDQSNRRKLAIHLFNVEEIRVQVLLEPVAS